MGVYKVHLSKDNKFYFNLLADNGERILTSEMYTTKGAAFGGVSSVKENAPYDGQYKRIEGAIRQHYFTLRAKNNEVIGKSELYSSAQACEYGIVSVKHNGPSSRVEDETGA